MFKDLQEITLLSECELNELKKYCNFMNFSYQCILNTLKIRFLKTSNKKLTGSIKNKRESCSISESL